MRFFREREAETIKTDNKIRAAIFDVDGTLVDSMGMWDTITFAYAEKKQIEAPEDLSRIMNTLSSEECAAYYKKLGAAGSEAEIFAELMDMAREGYRLYVPEVAGAAAFIRTLYENGIHCAVATASDLGALLPALDRLGIAPYIESVESCTTIGKSKAFPDIYLKCAADFGLSPSECVVFEDAPHAAETAKNAGFSVCGVLDGVWDEEATRALTAASDRCIRDYAELLSELCPTGET